MSLKIYSVVLELVRRLAPVIRVLRARSFALAGDILAGATLVSAAVSTYLSLSAGPERNVRVSATLGGLTLQGTY